MSNRSNKNSNKIKQSVFHRQQWIMREKEINPYKFSTNFIRQLNNLFNNKN